MRKAIFAFFFAILMLFFVSIPAFAEDTIPAEKITIFSFKTDFNFLNLTEKQRFIKECKKDDCRIKSTSSIPITGESNLNELFALSALKTVKFFYQESNHVYNDVKIEEILAKSDDGKNMKVTIIGYIGKSDEAGKLLIEDLEWGTAILEELMDYIIADLAARKFERMRIEEVKMSSEEIMIKVKAFPYNNNKTKSFF
ncbi:MAG: hypothetical protein A3J63_03440 [Candidatus Moranbacteria bacterium RIFCSPHIGHO2_02_FULL_40_12b]|nr:MAG: hypothetical protein A3J63_03440 [Candidatus Moranbacteria bacterium RIFCSPHIGHO2_02_FULL_40_12b]